MLKGTKQSITRMRMKLKEWQCDNCRQEKPCKCKKEDQSKPFKGAKAFLEDQNGKRKYYCNLGCILLMLNNENLEHFVNSQC